MIIYLNILNNLNKFGTLTATPPSAWTVVASLFWRVEAFLAKEELWRLFQHLDFRCSPSCCAAGLVAVRVHSASVTSCPPARHLLVYLAEDPAASPWPLPSSPSRDPSLLWPCGRCEDVCSETAWMWNTGRSEDTGECFHRFCAVVCAAGTVRCCPWWSHTLNSGTELSDALLREPQGLGPGRAAAPPPPPEGWQVVFQIRVPKKKSGIKSDHLRSIPTNNHKHLTKAFFESWLEVFDICPRSGFLIPCISLMWFFNIMLVANVVLVSVQYLKIWTNNQKSQQLATVLKTGYLVWHVFATQSSYQQV